MLKQDYAQFTTALDNACMDIGKDPMSKERRQSLFNRYAGFDLATMQAAIFAASGDDQVSFSGITPAILNKHLGVKALVDLEWGDVIAHAKNKSSPMGVLASLHIGSFELKERTNLENMVAAKSFLLELPKIAADLSAGIISDHALTIMHKNGVYPDRVPFMAGLPLPHGHVLLSSRTNEVMRLESYKAHNPENANENLAIESDPQGQLKVAKAMADIGSAIETVQPKKEYTGAEAAQILEDDLK